MSHLNPDEQVLSAWNALLKRNDGLTNEDLFSVMEAREHLRMKAAAELVRRNPTVHELTRLIGYRWFMGQGKNPLLHQVAERLINEGAIDFETLVRMIELEGDIGARAMERALLFNLTSNELLKLLDFTYYHPQFQPAVWSRLRDTGVPDLERFQRILIQFGASIREECGRYLMLHYRGTGRDRLHMISEIITFVPELHDELWPELSQKLAAGELLKLVDSLHYQIKKRRDWREEMANDDRCARWEKEATSYTRLRHAMCRELLELHPFDWVLIQLVGVPERELALEAADLILVGSSVQSPALRAIVLHLPERRQDAWKRLKSQKAFRKDFELIARHVPELKAEAAEILATFVTDKARHKKPSPASRKTPEPVSGSKSRAKLLTKLLGR